jgi:hypothetical protein
MPATNITIIIEHTPNSLLEAAQAACATIPS